MRLAIYMPCKYNAKDKFQKQMILDLTKTFSGLTIIPNCYGTWLDDKTYHVIHDNITLFVIYTDSELHAKRKVFFDAIKSIKEHYKQTCVAYTIDNAMFLHR